MRARECAWWSVCVFCVGFVACACLCLCLALLGVCHRFSNGVPQTYELWFKQILHELGSILRIFQAG